MSLHPVHLTHDSKGNLPPSALIPFCSYQGDSSLLGQQRPELDNLTICDKFEPTIFDGNLCYSLDVAKLDKNFTQEGKAGGLFLLLDPHPDQINFGVAQKRNEASTFKVYVHTLKQYTVNEGGAYAMRNLKRMTATESFELLPDSQKRCQVHNIVECQTQKFLEKVESKCGCTPWALISKSTKKPCGPDKERCVAEQPLRDNACLVACSGFYADITEESFLQQLRKERNAGHEDDDEKSVMLLTKEYTRFKQEYVRQHWFDPQQHNLGNFAIVPDISKVYIFSWHDGEVCAFKGCVHLHWHGNL